MKLPESNRRKALIVVDMQPAFIKAHNENIIERIVGLIQKEPYDAYIEAVFSAEKDSLWNKQQDWYSPKSEETQTVTDISKVLSGKDALKVHKHTRSVLRGDADVQSFLRQHSIEEVHIVGTETHDCVLATAYDVFDSGYPVYVIEECCESATEGRHEWGLTLLRGQLMTNNSCKIETRQI